MNIYDDDCSADIGDDMELDLLIIGGGPAGLTAGIYGVRAGLNTLVIEGGMPGGKISEAALVENYPGFPEGIMGLQLAQRFAEQAEKAGVPSRSFEKVQGIEKAEEGFIVTTDKAKYGAKAVVIATGMRDKKLLVPGEKEFAGRGVSYCFTCDGPLFKGKRVVVVGSGTGAVNAALYLADIAKEVTLLMKRREVVTSEEIMKKRLAHSRIKMLRGVKILEITGGELVEKVRVLDLKTEKEFDVLADGVFIEVGKKPNTDFLKGSNIKLDQGGFIIVDENQGTSIRGIFAAGDVVAGNIKQLGIAVAEGTKAALKAYEYIKQN
jgi:thioredoxin reductase (NADPH)